MIVRNCSHFLCILPILLSCELVSNQKRVRRISSPNFDEKFYELTAKYCVSIRSRTPHKYFGDNHFCSGTIISHSYVLTAANCAMDHRKILHRSRVLLVVAGSPNRLKQILHQTLNIPVKKVFVPTNFTVYNTNNIAILKLSKSLPINSHIDIIHLPTGPPTFGQLHRVMGWGRILKGGPLSAKLVYVDILLQEDQLCRSVVKTFKEEMLCAGNLDTQMDESPCVGDTGAPLIFNFTLVGVTSYALGCGQTGMPSVFTNVWYHIDWINGIINGGQPQSLMPLYIILLLAMWTMNVPSDLRIAEHGRVMM